MPASSASSRSSRAQNAWNVVTDSSSYAVAPTRVSIRSRRSSAAAVENVSARIASAGVPCARQPREALDQRVRLAGARAREDQQRAAGMGDRLVLRGRGLRHGHLRRIRPVSAPAPDWLGAARAAVRELQEVLAAAPTTAERARETGTRGEGGDRTLEIDAAAEEAVFRRLEELHARAIASWR